jgi:hypothetical protein
MKTWKHISVNPIAGASPSGPWLLSVERREISDELGPITASQTSGPGTAAFVFDHLDTLYEALNRTYRLGLSLPDVPLANFRSAVRNLPRTTEAERLVVQRIGQDLFRQALRSTGTGGVQSLVSPTLPSSAHHNSSLAECQTDEQRLDVHNGLLLSALWDAAFDSGKVSFDDQGIVPCVPHIDRRSARGSMHTERPRTHRAYGSAPG